jgi:hypothetical protein
MCNFALLPLMWSTPIPLGGLGLEPFRIGVALGSFGLASALVQVQIMGPVIRRFGSRRVFRVSSASSLLSFMMYPLMKYFAQRAGHVNGAVIACMIVQLCCGMAIYFAYGKYPGLSYTRESFLTSFYSGQVLSRSSWLRVCPKEAPSGQRMAWRRWSAQALGSSRPPSPLPCFQSLCKNNSLAGIWFTTS